MTQLESKIHIRFEGNSFDAPVGDLDIAFGSSDQQIKTAVARYLDISMDRLRNYRIDRHQTGNLTMRPEAVFG